MKRKDAELICLAEITGQFETNGQWSRVTNNFDGFGPSVGILQFSFGTGSLQPLLKRVSERVDMSDHFEPEDFIELFQVMRWSVREQRKHVNKYWFHGKRWKWNLIGIRDGLRSLAKTKEFRDEQFKASKKYARKAWKLYDAYDFKTLRAFAVFFDIAIQNGGVRMSTQEEIQLLRKHTRETLGRPMARIERLRNWARVRASKSSLKWQSDVLSRKMAIIRGGGKVHGREFDFSGLCLDRRVESS